MVCHGTRWNDDDSEEEQEQVKTSTKPQGPKVPAQGKRKGFIPRKVEDYADGGAFPEIHVAQYPLDMGRKGAKAGGVVSLQMDSEGNIKYDAILNQDRTHRKIVQSTARDLVAKKVTEMDLEKPDSEEVRCWPPSPRPLHPTASSPRWNT